jgi:SagB-type dehydrogenase family enzyme
VSEAEPRLKTIPLPPACARGGVALWEALRARRSRRQLERGGLSLAEAAQLAWAAQGVSAPELEPPRRTAPSAGALYPLETHLVVRRVEGLAAGIYRYDAASHALRATRAAEAAEALVEASYWQAVVAAAPLVLAFTSVIGRSRPKYGSRAPRYALLEAGHAAQNALLAAGALGLAACPIGSFVDEAMAAALGVDGLVEAPLYLVAVGRPGAAAER